MSDKKIPNPIDVHVGARVRYLRMMKGMGQEALAKQLGITFQQVQKYEKGTNRIGASRLQAIADALDTKIPVIFEGSDKLTKKSSQGFKEEQAGYQGGVPNSLDGLKLNQQFSKINDPKVRKKFIELMKSVAEALNNNNKK